MGCTGLGLATDGGIRLRSRPHGGDGWWGVLERVDRLGDRLSLTMRDGDRAHLGSVQWDAPPSVAEVEAVLRARRFCEERKLGCGSLGW